MKPAEIHVVTDTLPVESATPVPSTPTVSLVPTGTQRPTFAATLKPTTTLTNEKRKELTEDLIQAAELGDLAVVQQLLEDGSDINGRDALGRTPVMAATHTNQVEVVRVLIRAGADVNIRDNRLDNPFLYAGAEGLLDILRLTIEAGADTKLTNRYGGTALIPASEHGFVEIVQELLTKTDIDVNHVNDLGWTALLEAIILGDGSERQVEVVRLLVNAGADVNITDRDGVSPLSHARQRGYKRMVEILENAGAQ